MWFTVTLTTNNNNLLVALSCVGDPVRLLPGRALVVEHLLRHRVLGLLLDVLLPRLHQLGQVVVLIGRGAAAAPARSGASARWRRRRLGWLVVVVVIVVVIVRGVLLAGTLRP